jgi:CheY-like chemotaxis protein/glycine cleavage system H lipoate-binding protein
MSAEKKDILVIDDEQVILDSIVKIGKLEGLTVDSTDNGQKALDLLANNSYRLIISDIMMPVMDGFTLLGEVSERNLKTPVIMTTGYSTFDNAINSLFKGAIDFIPKPYTIEEISSVMQRGLKYSDIVFSADVRNDATTYVPCPSNYYRIGYACWVHMAGKNTVVTGITDLFNKTIDTIRKIELIEVGDHVAQANFAIKIETENDMIHQIYSPISGKVVARNDKILEDYSLLEKDPYFEGWIYQIEPNDFENEIKNLIPCITDRV